MSKVYRRIPYTNEVTILEGQHFAASVNRIIEARHGLRKVLPPYSWVEDKDGLIYFTDDRWLAQPWRGLPAVIASNDEWYGLVTFSYSPIDNEPYLAIASSTRYDVVNQYASISKGTIVSMAMNKFIVTPVGDYQNNVTEAELRHIEEMTTHCRPNDMNDEETAACLVPFGGAEVLEIAKLAIQIAGERL